MRALRVVGVTGDGSVVLEDPGRRERYTVPADEQLRAAARGDVTRLGQIAIELESQLRPREIQARIRGGASVDEVAAAAGVPTQKIERFAYPVLLERSRTAELAQSAHPQRADGPDSRTLGETVAHTFGLRGQDFTSAGWDSWKGEDGKWVVALTWQTGRSDNGAHWAFQPGAHGGTVVALDEHASDLVEGLPARPLRPLGAVVDMARDDEPAAPAPGSPSAEPARAVAGGQAPAPAESWAGRGIAPEQRRSSAPLRPRADTPARGGTRTDEQRPPAAAPQAGPYGDPAPATPDHTTTTPDTRPEDRQASAVADVDRPADDRAETGRPSPAAEPAAAGTTPGGDATASRTAPAGVEPVGTSATGSADSSTTGSADTATTGSAGAGTVGTEPTGTVHTGAAGTASTGSADDTATGPAPARPTATDGSADSAPAGDRTGGEAVTRDRPAPAAVPTPSPTPETAGDASRTDPAADASVPSTTDPATDTAPADGAPDGEDAPARPRGGSAASRKTKKGKPVMPSWDEVLLGVRGQR